MSFFVFFWMVLGWVLCIRYFELICLLHHRDEEAKAQMEVNFHGPLRIIQAAIPGFREQKAGTIVNITSMAGFEGAPGTGLYSASKFAVEGNVHYHQHINPDTYTLTNRTKASPKP